MSNPRERAAEDAYEAQNDDYAGDRVKGDSSYFSGYQRKTGGRRWSPMKTLIWELTQRDQ